MQDLAPDWSKSATSKGGGGVSSYIRSTGALNFQASYCALENTTEPTEQQVKCLIKLYDVMLSLALFIDKKKNRGLLLAVKIKICACKYGNTVPLTIFLRL